MDRRDPLVAPRDALVAIDPHTGKLYEWQCPPQATPADRRLGWLNENTEAGLAWLKSQRGHTDWRKALDVISGVSSMQALKYRSSLNSNHLKRNIREVVGTLSKLRPLWGYSSDNPAFAPNAQLFNLYTRAWYLESFADVKIKEALQYAAATCTGWVRPVYSRDFGGQGHGAVRLLSYGAPCILPTQLPPSGDFQQAYAMTILDEMPIYMAHGMFPKFQADLRPTSSLYWYSNEIRKSSQGNLWQRMFSFGKSAASTPGIGDLMVPIRYTYVIDLTRNTTSSPIPMGEEGTSWYYMAKPGDLLYPNRRLLISSESVVLYDGPSFDWHGRFPGIPFSTDHWPWEPLGFSMVRDGYDLQQAMTELERGTMDKERALLDLPLAYDINSVTKKEAQQFDPMQPRVRAGFDGSQSAEPFKMVVPPEVYKTQDSTLKFYELLKNAMDEQHGLHDALALAKSRGAGDDLEKILQSAGPFIEDASRSMEPPIREIADQVKFLVLQHVPPARIMQVVGEDGMTMEAFDYKPDSMVPSHLPGEDPGTAEKPIDSKTSKLERARVFASNLRFVITPRSLHEITQMSQRLMLIQLKKAGVQIDSQTIADACNVPNYGTIPGSTVREKFENEQEHNLMFAARMKALGMSLTEGGEMNPAGAQAGGKQQEGRPPSGQQAPELKSKPDGRSTITESPGGGRVV
jgi:hypothetical protein